MAHKPVNMDGWHESEDVDRVPASQYGISPFPR